MVTLNKETQQEPITKVKTTKRTQSFMEAVEAKAMGKYI